MRLASQPAAQEAAHEGVAGAEHVEHFDRKSAPDDAVLDAVGNIAGKDDAAHRPALQDDRRLRERADAAERGEIVLLAGGDVDFLLGADDQVAVGKHRLQVLRHRVGADVALLARRVAGEPPEVRAVVDVERDLAPGRARDPHRLLLRRRRAGLGKMRAGHDDRAGGADEALVDVRFGERHVGAVLAIEEQRKGAVVLDREDGERGQPLRIDLHAVERHALALQAARG